MRALIALTFIVAAMTGSATAQDQQLCRANSFVSVITFAPSTGLPANLGSEQLSRILRHARLCRVPKLDVVVYGDDDALAKARGRSIALRLEGRHWPQDGIAITRKPAREAPSGKDIDGAWTAGATIAFEGRDAHETIPPAYTRLNEPPGPYDPPNVMFDANSAMLSDASRSVAIEGGKIFQLENYRLIVLRGGATRTETNGAMLALARAAVVREALIRSGIDPAVIVIDPRATITPDEAPDSEWLDRRVTVDFSD